MGIIKGKSKNATEINSMMKQSMYSHRIGIVEEAKTFYRTNLSFCYSSDTIKFIEANNLYTSETLLYEETFYVLALNKANNLLGYSFIGVGDAISCIASVQKIFQFLLLLNAQAFICIHNHPSGREVPSQADIDLTRKLKEAGILFKCSLIDHAIVCPSQKEGELIGKYYSFADEGMI